VSRYVTTRGERWRHRGRTFLTFSGIMVLGVPLTGAAVYGFILTPEGRAEVDMVGLGLAMLLMALLMSAVVALTVVHPRDEAHRRRQNELAMLAHLRRKYEELQ
jgi:hypothetical protein